MLYRRLAIFFGASKLGLEAHFCTLKMGLIDRSIDYSVKRCRPAWSIRMIRRCLQWAGAPLCSRNLLRQSPSSKPGSPQSKRRPLSPDSAAKFALKLRLNDAPVSILVPRSTQIGASLRFECKSTGALRSSSHPIAGRCASGVSLNEIT